MHSFSFFAIPLLFAATVIATPANNGPQFCKSVRQGCGGKQSLQKFCFSYLGGTTSILTTYTTTTTSTITTDDEGQPTSGTATSTETLYTCPAAITAAQKRLAQPDATSIQQDEILAERAATKTPACLKTFSNAATLSSACSCIGTAKITPTNTVTATNPYTAYTTVPQVTTITQVSAAPTPTCTSETYNTDEGQTTYKYYHSGCGLVRQGSANYAATYDGSLSDCEAIALCAEYTAASPSDYSFEVYLQTDGGNSVWQCNTYHERDTSDSAFSVESSDTVLQVYGYSG